MKRQAIIYQFNVCRHLKAEPKILVYSIEARSNEARLLHTYNSFSWYFLLKLLKAKIIVKIKLPETHHDRRLKCKRKTCISSLLEFIRVYINCSWNSLQKSNCSIFATKSWIICKCILILDWGCIESSCWEYNHTLNFQIAIVHKHLQKNIISCKSRTSNAANLRKQKPFSWLFWAQLER